MGSENKIYATESGELVRTELTKKTHLSIVTMLCITEFGF